MAKGKKDDVFMVERIVDRRVQNRQVMYLVKWQGYSTKQNSWEPASSFVNRAMVEDFEQKRRQRTAERHVLKELREQRKAKKEQSERKKALPPSSSRTSAGGRKPPTKRTFVVKREENERPPSPAPKRASPAPSTPPTAERAAGSSAPVSRKRPRILERRPKIKTEPPADEKTPEAQRPPAITITPPAEEMPAATDERPQDGENRAVVNGVHRKQSWRVEPEDCSFPLHPRNGLIGAQFDQQRFDALLAEMDEAVESEGREFAAAATDRYQLSRVILCAKRANGTAAYIRLLDQLAARTYRFECVPLELLADLYPEAVLAYIQARADEQIQKENGNTEIPPPL
ncbi:Ribonuclease H-like domain [Aphelenchoides fujianensis]|nr:Ribonuclease H-like domain [Aphelenchoides fujianensis]